MAEAAAVAEETEAAAKPKKAAKPAKELSERQKVPLALAHGGIAEARAVRSHWCVTPRPEVRPDDLLRPEYWKHVVQRGRIRPRDIIEAECEDGSWWAMYYVRHVGMNGASLYKLHEADMSDVSDDAPDDVYEVKYLGPVVRYCVMRTSDGERVSERHQTPELAHKWIATQRRAA